MEAFGGHCVSKFMSSPKSMLRPIWIRPTFQGKRAGAILPYASFDLE
jgi:hypothetical protein